MLKIQNKAIEIEKNSKFPLLIQYTGVQDYIVARVVSDIVAGKSFRIIETNFGD